MLVLAAHWQGAFVRSMCPEPPEVKQRDAHELRVQEHRFGQISLVEKGAPSTSKVDSAAAAKSAAQDAARARARAAAAEDQRQNL